MRRGKGKVMVSINDHPDIRRAFDGFHFETLDIRYSTTNQPTNQPTARPGSSQWRACDNDLAASRSWGSILTFGMVEEGAISTRGVCPCTQ